MIRRPIKLEDHSPGWMLISQPDHARIAYELACSWGRPPLRPLPLTDTLLPTLLHHDDGWQTWEELPDIEPERGHPYSFTEMVSTVAHGIWDECIGACQQLGPLAQYLVASHFLHLCKMGESAHSSVSVTFVQKYEELANHWLGEWQQESPDVHTPELANSALRYLQMFDALSLWLCCEESDEPQEWKTPDGDRLMFRPVEGGNIVVSPWPWIANVKALRLTARSVPAKNYRAREELAGAPCHLRSLNWVLTEDHSDSRLE